MMWHIVFIIGINFGVSLAMFESSCHPKKCLAYAPRFNPMVPEDLLPGGERLKSYCPGLLAMIECGSNNFLLCGGQNISDITDSDNETIAAAANIFLGITDLIMDLCNESTAIHNAYVSNVECVRNVSRMSDIEAKCADPARNIFLSYQMSRSSSGANVNPQHNQFECMTAAYALACLSGEIHKACGEEARATLIEMMKRTKLMRYERCSADDIEELKTTYIDFLELEGERRSIFEKAFDFRRR